MLLGCCWGVVGVVLGCSWGVVGVLLGCCWGVDGVLLGWLGCRCGVGVLLGCCWGGVGVLLGWLGCYKQHTQHTNNAHPHNTYTHTQHTHRHTHTHTHTQTIIHRKHRICYRTITLNKVSVSILIAINLGDGVMGMLEDETEDNKLSGVLQNCVSFFKSKYTGRPYTQRRWCFSPWGQVTVGRPVLARHFFLL